MEQGNMMNENATDANELIREANIHNLQDYQGKIKQDKSAAQEGNIYHGGLAAGSLAGLKSFSSEYKRGVKLDGFKNMVSSDFRNLVPSFLKKSPPTSVSESVPFVRAKPATGSFADSVGARPAIGLSSRPASEGDELEEEPLFKNSAPTIEPTATPRAPPTSARPITSAEPTSAPETAPSSAVESEGKVEGGLVARGLEKVGVGAVGTLANTAVSKSLGNVGGAIDLIEDFHNIGKKGGFLGGQGNTKEDKVSGAMTLGSTALDIASIALPFLAPVAAVASVVSGAEGISNAVANNIKAKQGTTSNYKANIETYKTPQSAAGLGFLATTQVDPVKSIGGGGTF